MRISFLLFSFILSVTVIAQPCPRLDAELELVKYSRSAIPVDLAASRTAVLICHQLSPGGEAWKELAHEIHGSLAQMSIDPVLYVNAFDYYASSLATKSFQSLLRTRRIQNLIVLVVRGNYDMDLMLIPYAQFTKKDGRGQGWKTSSSGAVGLIYQLGVAVKQAELRSSNFLISGQPEFLEDIKLFSGDKLANYAGAMRRQRVGLALMEEIPVPNTLSDDQRQKVEAFNESVRAENERMKQAFEGFGYDWLPIVYTTDEVAVGDQIQYIVFLLHTSGEHVRQMLNYNIDKNETEYLSVTPGTDRDVNLKRLPANSLMYKVYVAQTRAKDVFVGEEWDADVSPELALSNFIFTWKRQVEGK